MRPVASDNAAYFVIDGADDFEALLDLPADQFKFLRAEGTAVQEFHWHVSPTRKSGTAFLGFAPRHGRRRLVEPGDHRHWRRARAQRTAQAEH